MIMTENLIDQLTHLPARRALLSPAQCAARVAFVLLVYAVGVSTVLGIRPDLALQFTRLPFMLETMLLLALAVASVYAAALSRFPDRYQRDRFLLLPYGLFIMILALLSIQGFIPPDPRMVLPAHDNAMDCALCVAMVAVVPSALIFILLKRGASVHPFQAGSFAVLAATAVGCLALRLEEQNDSIAHLVTWHYLPTLLFACAGAVIGKWLLKW